MSSDRNNETKRVKTTSKMKKIKKSTNSKSEKGKKVKFKDKHPKAAKWLKIGIIIFILLSIIGCGVLVGAFFGIFGDELKIEPESLVVGYENSIVYDADGNQIAELSAGAKRKSISLDQMSKYLPKAYVAIEDEGFYNHNGIDLSRTAYATITYVLNGGNSSFGGSTITQQVIKNITQDKERTALAGVMRKVKEISKAIQVEQYLSKDQILELYLNLIFVGGDDINGVELGSIYYFDKSAKDLSIAECAYMAGINHSPNAYKPFKDFSNVENGDAKKKEMDDKIKTRTLTVLMKMEELGYITKEEYDTACSDVEKGLNFKRGESAETTVDVSYVVEEAIDQILNRIIAENEDMDRKMAEMQLYSNGYKIYTTQKSNIQAIVEEEIVKERFFTSVKEKVKNEETGETEEIVQYSNPTIVIMDHTTGHVVAAATATGEKENRTATTKLGFFNYVTKNKKQTGSSMKPIAVIAPGVEAGVLTGGTVYYNQLTTWGPKSAKPWRPKNSTGYSEFSTLRTAIEKSHNIPHAKALTTIGTEVAIEFCKKLGFPDFTDEGLSLSLGGLQHGVSPADMAGAYAMIANNGVYKTPIYYTKVEDGKGEVVFEVSQEETQVMTEQNAFIVKDILKQPVISGTATYCRIPNMDVAAKTGTTNDDYDRWLCGFTPYYTGACWYGYKENAKVRFSGNPAGYLWDEIMTRIHKDLELEPTTFVEPEGIIRRSTCRVSGKLSGPNCGENAYMEVYTADNVPKATCEGHGSITICNESKQMATPHCPDQVPVTGYIPEYEKNAIWVTERMVQTDITMTCPLHGGGAPIGGEPAPAPAPAPAPEPAPAPTPAPTPTPEPSKPAECKHSNTKTTRSKATCTTDGREVITCTDTCKKVISDKVIEKATGHNWGAATTTKEPKCCVAGVATKKCTNPGCDAKDTSSLPATQNHTYNAADGCVATKQEPSGGQGGEGQGGNGGSSEPEKPKNEV